MPIRASRHHVDRFRPRLSHVVIDYAQIVLGSALVGIGTNLFFVPHDIVSGGVTGVAILAHAVLHTPVGAGVLVLNLPLLWLGWRYAGGTGFLLRTAVAVAVLSLTIDVSAPFLSTPTNDRLLIIGYGGLMDGVGMGLVFRARGTTGGTDIVARLARKRLGWPIGQSLLVMNAIIFLSAAGIFGLEEVMVALAMAFVSARAVDLVQEGFPAARSAIIVSTRPDDVRDAIFERIGRGVTYLEGRGGFRGDTRPVLLVVIAANEVVRLKRLLAEVDREAFVTISPAKEVLGEGFAPIHPSEEG
jgi:uncharacterized membrane-anchored protein YitT (DUF2179 family)